MQRWVKLGERQKWQRPEVPASLGRPVVLAVVHPDHSRLAVDFQQPLADSSCRWQHWLHLTHCSARFLDSAAVVRVQVLLAGSRWRLVYHHLTVVELVPQDWHRCSHSSAGPGPSGYCEIAQPRPYPLDVASPIGPS